MVGVVIETGVAVLHDWAQHAVNLVRIVLQQHWPPLHDALLQLNDH